jgi:hypothetical protein
MQNKHTTDSVAEFPVLRNGCEAAVCWQANELMHTIQNLKSGTENRVRLRLFVHSHIDILEETGDSDASSSSEASRPVGPFENQIRLAERLMHRVIKQLALKKGTCAVAAITALEHREALKSLGYTSARFAIIGPKGVSLQQQSAEDLQVTADAGIHNIVRILSKAALCSVT